MSLISRYVALRFFGFWLLCLFALLGLVLLSESFNHINLLVSGFEGQVFLLRQVIGTLPQAIELMLLMAVLLAVRLTHNAFLRTNEWHTMRGAGLSTFRLYTSLWPVLLLTSLLGHLNQNQFGNWVASVQQNQTKENRNHVWQLHESDIVYVRKMLLKKELAQGVLVLHNIASSKHKLQMLYFEELQKSQGQWQLTKKTSPQLPHSNLNNATAFTKLPKEALDIILSQKHISTRTLSLNELWHNIRQSAQQNTDPRLYWLELSQEFALLASPFLLAWFALTIVSSPPRHTRTTVDLIMMLLVGVAFFLGQEILWLLGQSGKLAIPLATWGMNILLLLLSFSSKLNLKKAS